MRLIAAVILAIGCFAISDRTEASYLAATYATEAGDIRVMTFNIRYNEPRTMLTRGQIEKNSWPA
jgi:hypothetical protein